VVKSAGAYHAGMRLGIGRIFDFAKLHFVRLKVIYSDQPQFEIKQLIHGERIINL
jgi:hypothetical protein